MTHEQIQKECEALGLHVERTPDTGARSYQAKAAGVRVYWRTSTEGGLLGLPRVNYAGTDTHARSVQEIRYLVSQDKLTPADRQRIGANQRNALRPERMRQVMEDQKASDAARKSHA